MRLDPRTFPGPIAGGGAANGAGANGVAYRDRSPAKPSAEPDPVAELRFKVEVGGLSIGRFKEVTGLSAQVDVKEYAEGGVNQFVHKLPGRIKWGPITLKRGITHEDALIQWFWEVRTKARLAELHIALLGPGMVNVRKWSFLDAFPTKWTGPNLNAGSNQIATETLEIVHNGLTQAA